MRITNNMFWNNSGRINSSMLGSALTSRVGRKSTAAMTRSSQTGSFYNTISNQLNNYSKIGSASEDLRSSAAQLSANNNMMFAIAKHGGSRKGLLEQAKSMVEGYNSTVDGLNRNPSSLNNTYKKMLENTFSENSEALKSIGITIGKDRSVSIDEKKFNSAGIDKIEKVLGSEGGFTSRVASIADGIGRSAMTNPYSSYSPYSQYGSSALLGYGRNMYGSNALSGYGGSDYGYLSAMLGSRYNFWM